TDIEKLAAVITGYPLATTIVREGNFLQLRFAKGSSKLDDVNQFCFSHGIILNHLLLKKQRLEAKFFELTSN
ncbi:MAG TPA: ABC transporter ATP-binding protein, partial [Puia sp.]|nr:ABC transporter ATP-binding protein [Puia sp.]